MIGLALFLAVFDWTSLIAPAIGVFGSALIGWLGRSVSRDCFEAEKVQTGKTTQTLQKSIDELELRSAHRYEEHRDNYTRLDQKIDSTENSMRAGMHEVRNTMNVNFLTLTAKFTEAIGELKGNMAILINRGGPHGN